MKILLLGDRSKRIVNESLDLMSELGMVEVSDPSDAQIILAPLLRSKIATIDIEKTQFGALVFHPSLLPFYRGRNAIKDAFAACERVTGASWFWATDRFDEGAICEQEPLGILSGESPREFYERAVIPSAIRLLRFALRDIGAGIIRKRPQNPTQ